MALVLPLLLLLLLTFETVKTERVFELVGRCPPPSGGLKDSAWSQSFCCLLCRQNPDCSIFHYDKVSQLCHRGNSTASGDNMWSFGSCNSFQLDGGSSLTSQLVKQLSLKLLYRFATHSLVNVADPTQFTLRSINVTVNDEGAHFGGRIDSYLTTETPGFENVVNNGREFTLFTQVKHTYSHSGDVYGVFGRCPGDKSSVRFSRSYNSIQIIATLMNVQKKIVVKSLSLMDNSAPDSAPISIGVTFNETDLSNFFLDGQTDEGRRISELPNSYLSDSSFACLELGRRFNSDDISLNGTMTCFGVSERRLTKSEFLLLHNWCLEKTL